MKTRRDVSAFDLMVCYLIGELSRIIGGETWFYPVNEGDPWQWLRPITSGFNLRVIHQGEMGKHFFYKKGEIVDIKIQREVVVLIEPVDWPKEAGVVFRLAQYEKCTRWQGCDGYIYRSTAERTDILARFKTDDEFEIIGETYGDFPLNQDCLDRHNREPGKPTNAWHVV